jgi:mevalonate kinase
MIVVKVPLKITLFGEYAVVFKKPAIAATLPVYMLSKVVPNNDGILYIKSSTLLGKLHMISIDRTALKVVDSYVEEAEVLKFLRYVLKALELCEEEIRPGSRKGFYIEMESPVPAGVGLGTSAAVSVATVSACLATYIGGTEVDRNLIARIAWKTEQEVQGAASPMDTYTITFGGLRYIEPSVPFAEEIKTQQKLPVLVGYVPKKATTAELVNDVKRKGAIVPEVFNAIIDTIGLIVNNAKQAILKNDLEMLGILMNMNHGLLEALNVVSVEHSLIVKALRAVGALGAKTSGAGGGGAFVALARSHSEIPMLSKVAEAFNAKIIASEIGSSGVMIAIS